MDNMTFFYVFSAFLGVLYGYTGLRLIPSLFKKKTAVIAFILLIFLWATLVFHIYFLITDTHPGWSRILAWIGYPWLGAMSYFFLLAFARDLLILPFTLIAAVKKRRTPKKMFAPPASRERRQFLFKTSSVGITLLSTSLAGVGTFLALQKPKVVRVSIPLPSHLSGLKGLTLAQFTDLHVGPTVGVGYVTSVCDTLQELNADIIAFTGDLADGTPDQMQKDLEPLGYLSAPLGKYFITGNHEYYSGANRWIIQAALLGYESLINEHRVIRYNGTKLTLGGVTDAHSNQIPPFHQSNPKTAFKGAPDNSFKLLLAHQPTSVYAAAKEGVDLQLSGHTHGGQYFPFDHAVRLLHPFVKGMYQYQDTKVYVNQGTGYWGPPLRIGTFPEVTLFTFT